MRWWQSACVLSAGLTACGTTATPADATDTSVDASADATASCPSEWKQGYCLKFTFHGGKNDGQTYTLSRDLSGTSGTLVFGSTHMAYPAVALSLTDTWSLGAYKDQLQFRVNLGTLIEAPGFPAYVPHAGDFPFSCLPPSVAVTFKNVVYQSTCPGLTGSFGVTTWGAAPGDRFIGTVHGTLQQYLTTGGDVSDCTASVAAARCTATTVTVDVDGHFGLTLPAKDAAVAP